MTLGILVAVPLALIAGLVGAGLWLWNRNRLRAGANLAAAACLATLALTVILQQSDLGLALQLRQDVETALNERDALAKEVRDLRTVRLAAEAEHHQALDKIEREVVALQKRITPRIESLSTSTIIRHVATSPPPTGSPSRADAIANKVQEIGTRP